MVRWIKKRLFYKDLQTLNIKNELGTKTMGDFGQNGKFEMLNI